MKKLLNSKFVKDIAVYAGIGTPYFFLLEKLGVDFTGIKGFIIMCGLYICIDITRWGLRK